MEQNTSDFHEVKSTKSTESTDKQSISYTPSVNSVRSSVDEDAVVLSMDLIQILARIHPEYAKGSFKKVAQTTYEERPFATMKAGQWFQEVEQLFNPELVNVLHGRLLALGLCELDLELRSVLKNSGVYTTLLEELNEDFNSLLIDKTSGDPAVLHLDSDANTDHLGRDGFVEALAIWLNRFWRRSNTVDKRGFENSFMMHLHGPWGSGKSTLLNLLEHKLTRSDEKENLQWIVIHFNAWQHSHVEPVWWPLLNQLYKESHKNLKDSGENRKARSIWRYDFYWKLISGNKSTGYWFAFFAVLLIVVSLPEINETLQSYIQIATFTGSVVTATSYFFRSLIWGSAGSAKDYLKLTQDPLENIKTYFKEIVKRIDHPVIIYIDDLDRCPASYVVDLLESLQTLFNDSRVFYVLAADRRWLYGSFEERYREFQNHIEEPGKQIGYLFLDKLFQLSISVPQVSPSVREQYLNYLYLGKNQSSHDLEKIRQQARKEFKNIKSESELIMKLGRDQEGMDSRVDQIRREEAVRASAKAEIEISTEYFLKQFAHLLEPNPRSIKRLVNNYGIYRAIIMLSDPKMIDSEEKRKKFTLWNIVSMRWPLLAEHMDESREDIAFILNGSPDNIKNETIRAIVIMQRVRDVISGREIGTNLDAEYVTQILNLQAAPA